MGRFVAVVALSVVFVFSGAASAQYVPPGQGPGQGGDVVGGEQGAQPPAVEQQAGDEEQVQGQQVQPAQQLAATGTGALRALLLAAALLLFGVALLVLAGRSRTGDVTP